jgi:two-component system, cell cycle response regulator DivK
MKQPCKSIHQQRDQILRGTMKAKILIIDDDPAILALVKYMLDSRGHTVVAAGDGEAGLKAARQLRPDLILSDADIPKLDGCELARRLKADPSLREIPLIAVTASAKLSDCERMIAVGFSGCVAKPFIAETFVSQIEAYLPATLAAAKPRPAESKPKSDAKTRLIRELAEKFFESLPTLLADLHAAYDKADFKSLRAMTHRMLGSCIFLNDPALVESLRQAEQMIDTRQTAALKPMLEEVDHLARGAAEYLTPLCV